MTNMTWFEPVEYYFQTLWCDQSSHGAVPNPFDEAIKRTLGRDFNPELVVPTDPDSGAVAFLMVEEGGRKAALVAFDPPAKTTVTHLGSLYGGDYAEEVTVGDDGSSYEIVGTFTHMRLRSPLRAVYRPATTSSAARDGTSGDLERTERLLELFRQWATTPPPHAAG
jgi:hypothetical protein